jgi:hypothetical protein
MTRSKYTIDQIESVIKLKEQLRTNSEIKAITGVKLSKIKEIIKQNGLFLSPDQAQSNAYRSKLSKNPNCMEDMRKKLQDPGIIKKRSESIRATYNSGNYDKDSMSVKAKERFEQMKLNKASYSKGIKNRSKKSQETKLGIPYTQFTELMETIKKEVTDQKGSVCGLALKYNLDANTVSRYFHKAGWSDLVDGAYSTPEKDILNFIKSVAPNLEVIENSRTVIAPYELDIYVPSKHFAIEYKNVYIFF